MLKELEQVLLEKRLYLSVTDSAKDFIIENGYDAVYGARPLKRFISHTAQTLIAKYIISNDVAENTKLILDVENQNLVVKQ